MRGLDKTWPGGKKALEAINLSFYSDAKNSLFGRLRRVIAFCAGRNAAITAIRSN